MAKTKKTDSSKRDINPASALSIGDFLKLIQKEVKETMEEIDLDKIEDEESDDIEDDEESYLMGFMLIIY